MLLSACASTLTGRNTQERQLTAGVPSSSEQWEVLREDLVERGFLPALGPDVQLREQRVVYRLHEPHPIDVVISDQDGFVFVDNVKAASTTIRTLLQSKLNISWWDGCDIKYKDCCSHLGRTTTACLSEEHAGYFVFGFARHPVAKFESGVQQAWLQSEELKRFSADELLAQQLQSGFFLNEHLQPSHYRFSGLTHLGTPVQMDFVGKVEAMEEDMQRAARTHCRRRKKEAQRKCLSFASHEDCFSQAKPSCQLWEIANAIGLSLQNHHEPDSRSVLSEDGLRQLCSSEFYKTDADMYGYNCLERPITRQGVLEVEKARLEADAKAKAEAEAQAEVQAEAEAQAEAKKAEAEAQAVAEAKAAEEAHVVAQVKAGDALPFGTLEEEALPAAEEVPAQPETRAESRAARRAARRASTQSGETEPSAGEGAMMTAEKQEQEMRAEEEAMVRATPEAEAGYEAEALARAQAAEEAAAEEEAEARAEAEAKAEENTRLAAEAEAKARTNAERKADRRARKAAESQAKAEAEAMTKVQAEESAKALDEAKARVSRRVARRARAAEQGQGQAQAQANAQAEAEARIASEAETASAPAVMAEAAYETQQAQQQAEAEPKADEEAGQITPQTVLRSSGRRARRRARRANAAAEKEAKEAEIAHETAEQGAGVEPVPEVLWRAPAGGSSS